MAKFSMTSDEVCVNLVGDNTLSLKVDNPKYVLENTWPMIKDMDEDDAFKFFHYWVSRAIYMLEIENSPKMENREVVREHPDPKHQVVLSYDEVSVKLETRGKTLVHQARFPHYVFEHLVEKMEDMRPKHALHVFHQHAHAYEQHYEYPDDFIILNYFKDYEYPEDTYDHEKDEQCYRGCACTSPCRCWPETAPVPVPVPAPVPVPRKSWFNVFRMFRRS
jgi:hypothetical protein